MWDQIFPKPVLLTETSSVYLFSEAPGVSRKKQGSESLQLAASPFRSIVKRTPVTTRDAGLGVRALGRPVQSLLSFSPVTSASQHLSRRSIERQALAGHPNRVIVSSFRVSLGVSDQESSFWKQIDQNALCNLLGNLCESLSPQLGPYCHHCGL